MDRIKFVWAKNKTEFNWLCCEMCWKEGPDCRYITGEQYLRGHHGIDIIKYGRYYERRRYHDEESLISWMQVIGDAKIYGVSYADGLPALQECLATLGPGFGK